MKYIVHSRFTCISLSLSHCVACVGDTALHKAVVNGHIYCAEVLISHGAAVNSVVRRIIVSLL